jgi:hypothetical protein
MNVLGGIFFMFIGLISACLGVIFAQANRRTIRVADPPSRRSFTHADPRLHLAIWIVSGLGWVGFGVTVMRHSRGSYVEVPASAPLIDQLIYIASLVCITGAFFALAAVTLTNPNRPRLSRRRPSDQADG